MLTDAAVRCLDTIYSTDLVYVPGCWKLCGNAHCCNFERYKSKMTMIGKRHKQELPLLPGEMEYMRSRGLAGRAGAYEHRVVEYPLRQGVMKLEFLVGRDQMCACAHESRTAVCRLYPLMPSFDVAGRVTGADAHFGFFEEMEDIDAAEHACKVEGVPFTELPKFMAVANAMGSVPKYAFYVTAYQLTKAHAKARLKTMVEKRKGGTAFNTFEGAFLLRQLIDHTELRPQLEALADQFAAHYGDAFKIDGPPVAEGGSTTVETPGGAPVPVPVGHALPPSGRKTAIAS